VLARRPSCSDMILTEIDSVLSEVNSVVKDRASHQHKRKRITDALFHHDFNPLCRLHHDKADIPRLHRRVDEAVERFQVRAP
jgi:hypothetical protein